MTEIHKGQIGLGRLTLSYVWFMLGICEMSIEGAEGMAMKVGAGFPVAARANCRWCRGGTQEEGSGQRKTEREETTGPIPEAKNGPAIRSSESRRPSPTAGSDQRMIGRDAFAGRLTEAQQELVVQNIGLVGLHLRNRVPTPRRPTRMRERADLFQVGCMALIRAAIRYDPASHGPFPAYALPRIRGAIFTAVHEYFATIRVPRDVIVRRRKELALNGRTSIQRLPIVHQWRGQANIVTPHRAVTETQEWGDPTIRALARSRFERAVQAALEELKSRRWRRRDASEVMARIAAERILVSPSPQQTRTRQLSSLLGVSSGRISEYEQLLRETIQQHLSRDALLPLLLQFAREDPAGMDGCITCERRERLHTAEMKAFESQLAAMERSRRAELLYGLVEQSGKKPDDVIRKLYRRQVWNKSLVPM